MIKNNGSYGVAVLYGGTSNAAFGTRVTINGSVQSTWGLSVNGLIKQTTGNIPEIIVGETGEIISNGADGAGIYGAGYAEYIIAGELLGSEFGIEVRAGELTIKDTAVITATGDFTDPAPNGNGSTVKGVAGCRFPTHYKPSDQSKY